MLTLEPPPRQARARDPSLVMSPGAPPRTTWSPRRVALMSASDVGGALATFVRFQRWMHDASSHRLEIDGTRAVLRFGLAPRRRAWWCHCCRQKESPDFRDDDDLTPRGEGSSHQGGWISKHGHTSQPPKHASGTPPT